MLKERTHRVEMVDRDGNTYLAPRVEATTSAAAMVEALETAESFCPNRDWRVESVKHV